MTTQERLEEIRHQLDCGYEVPLKDQKWLLSLIQPSSQPADTQVLIEALKEIESWRVDVLSGDYPETPENVGFRRGCRMAYHRCAEAAKDALATFRSAPSTIEPSSQPDKLGQAMSLLARAAEHCGENPPDSTWFRDWFLLTGEHMIRTDEGWEPGSCKAELIEDFDEDVVNDEVNAPVQPNQTGGK